MLKQRMAFIFICLLTTVSFITWDMLWQPPDDIKPIEQYYPLSVGSSFKSTSHIDFRGYDETVVYRYKNLVLIYCDFGGATDGIIIYLIENDSIYEVLRNIDGRVHKYLYPLIQKNDKIKLRQFMKGFRIHDRILVFKYPYDINIDANDTFEITTYEREKDILEWLGIQPPDDDVLIAIRKRNADDIGEYFFHKKDVGIIYYENKRTAVFWMNHENEYNKQNN